MRKGRRERIEKGNRERIEIEKTETKFNGLFTGHLRVQCKIL